MELALVEYLKGRPLAYIDEMRYFLWNAFDVFVTKDTVRRALRRHKITNKRPKKRASERKSKLRQVWMERLHHWRTD